MYGGMQSWYFTHLIGLTKAAGVAGAGYKSIRVAPQVPTVGSSSSSSRRRSNDADDPPGLAGAALQLQTDHGEIRVQWTQANATGSAATRFALSVTVPLSTHAELCVPTFGKTASVARITESGKLAWVAGKFVNVAGCTGGSANTVPGGGGAEICFACGCGSYRLELMN
eukprot:SAG11_NODE_524_length_8751_cov_4.292765_9_plen_169_part_00